VFSITPLLILIQFIDYGLCNYFFIYYGLKPAGNVAEDPKWENPKDPYIKHWDQICQTMNMMWQRWRRDILPTFHTFPKWTKWSKNPKLGEMVMV
jgi:hypothetical protein